ncbi:hypothetical protein D3C72_1748580 [compost metagenome]
MGRFVKTVKRLDLLDALGVHALRPAVAQPASFSATTARSRFGLGHVLLHRAAGHKLNHHKGQQQHTEQGGQHEQYAFEDVGEHGRGVECVSRYFLSGAVWGGIRAHQVSMTQPSPLEYGGTTSGLARRQAL